MTWPVLPPTFWTLLVTEEPTLLAVSPAELVTFDRPCCALPAVSETASLALVAWAEAAEVASDVVEAARRCTAKRVWRSAIREATRADMVNDGVVDGGVVVQWQWQRGW